MEFILRNVAYVIYGMGFMLFLISWINLYKKKKKNRIFRFIYWGISFMLFIYLRNLFSVHEKIWDNELYLRINNCLDIMIVPATASLLLSILSSDKLSIKAISTILTPPALLSVAYFITLSETILIIIAVYTACLVIVAVILIYYVSSKSDNSIKRSFYKINVFTVGRLKKGILPLSGIVVPDLISVTTRDSEDIKNTSDHYFFIEKLKEYIEKEKPYLSPTLSLSDLAAGLGTNRTYLSDYLNNTLHISFYDYINSYRIKIACELLKDYNTNLDLVAEKSGFNSLSTFRRSFIKCMGCTPKQYRNKALNLMQ